MGPAHPGPVPYCTPTALATQGPTCAPSHSPWVLLLLLLSAWLPPVMAPAPAPKRCSPTALGILYGTHDTGFAIAAGRHVALLVQLSHVQVKGDPGFFGADHNRTNETWARAWALAIAQLQDMLPVTAASSEAIGTAAGTRTLPGSGAADDAGAWGKGPRGALVFDTVAVHTYKGAHMPALPDYVRGRQWNWRTNHHEDGHAPAAFYDSPFETALVLSLDGAGNDGSTVVFRADRAAHSIAPVARAPQSVGLYYYCVWRALKAHWSMRRWQDMAHWEPMNYAALGSPDTGLTARLGAALHKIVKKVIPLHPPQTRSRSAVIPEGGKLGIREIGHNKSVPNYAMVFQNWCQILPHDFQETSATHVVLHGARGAMRGPVLKSLFNLLQSVPNVLLLEQASRTLQEIRARSQQSRCTLVLVPQSLPKYLRIGAKFLRTKFRDSKYRTFPPPVAHDA